MHKKLRSKSRRKAVKRILRKTSRRKSRKKSRRKSKGKHKGKRNGKLLKSRRKSRKKSRRKSKGKRNGKHKGKLRKSRRKSRKNKITMGIHNPGRHEERLRRQFFYISYIMTLGPETFGMNPHDYMGNFARQVSNDIYTCIVDRLARIDQVHALQNIRADELARLVKQDVMLILETRIVQVNTEDGIVDVPAVHLIDRYVDEELIAEKIRQLIQHAIQNM